MPSTNRKSLAKRAENQAKTPKKKLKLVQVIQARAVVHQNDLKRQKKNYRKRLQKFHLKTNQQSLPSQGLPLLLHRAPKAKMTSTG